MKHLKQILTIFTVALFIFSCNTPERSVGMTAWEGVEDMKWHIGTQSAVDIAKAMDAAWQARNYDEMRNYISDTATITSANGYTFESVDAFIERRKSNDSVWDSNGSTFEWSFTNLFSVDLDPTRGGEHVHVNYSGKYEDKNGADTWNAINRYYVIDGKVVWWDTFAQEIIDTETEQ